MSFSGIYIWPPWQGRVVFFFYWHRVEWNRHSTGVDFTGWCWWFIHSTKAEEWMEGLDLNPILDQWVGAGPCTNSSQDLQREQHSGSINWRNGMEMPRDLQGKHSQSSGSEVPKSPRGGDRSGDSQVNWACREPRDPGRAGGAQQGSYPAQWANKAAPRVLL